MPDTKDRPLPPAPEPSPQPSPTPAGAKLAIEEHAATGKTPTWLFRAAMAMRGWAQGAEVTAAEYQQAIEAAGTIRISSR